MLKDWLCGVRVTKRKDDSYLAGMSTRVSGGLVVPFSEPGKSRGKMYWQEERARRWKMNQGFSLKPVKCEISGTHPGSDGREAVGWQPLKIEAEREKTDISRASAMPDTACVFFGTPQDLVR